MDLARRARARAVYPAVTTEEEAMETAVDLEPLKFPIGRWDLATADDGEAAVAAAIEAIAAAPARLRAAVAGLDDEQLDTPYRPGGWTVRQVVHHVPDSHLNAYVRTRWALTEETPAIKVYEEHLWAELPDARSGPVAMSLALLDAVHERWLRLLRALGPEQLDRAYRHPQMGVVGLRKMLSLYAWHGRHHEAHVTSLRARRGW
jgi:uncharacterized damage-inducible protein DinB